MSLIKETTKQQKLKIDNSVDQRSDIESVVLKSNKSLSDDNTLRFSYDLYGSQKFNKKKEPKQKFIFMQKHQQMDTIFKNIKKQISLNKRKEQTERSQDYKGFLKEKYTTTNRACKLRNHDKQQQYYVNKNFSQEKRKNKLLYKILLLKK